MVGKRAIMVGPPTPIWLALWVPKVRFADHNYGWRANHIPPIYGRRTDHLPTIYGRRADHMPTIIMVGKPTIHRLYKGGKPTIMQPKLER